MADFIVSDTGPLISLEKLKDGFVFIRKLYPKIIITPSVLDEVYQGSYAKPEDYLKAYGLADLIEIKEPKPSKEITNKTNALLHKAEMKAISLALQEKSPLLIEETMGRNLALSLGIKISGIAGQIIKAFKEGIIEREEGAEKLRELFKGGRINQEIYEILMLRILKTRK